MPHRNPATQKKQIRDHSHSGNNKPKPILLPHKLEPKNEGYTEDQASTSDGDLFNSIRGEGSMGHLAYAENEQRLEAETQESVNALKRLVQKSQETSNTMMNQDLSDLGASNISSINDEKESDSKQLKLMEENLLSLKQVNEGLRLEVGRINTDYTNVLALNRKLKEENTQLIEDNNSLIPADEKTLVQTLQEKVRKLETAISRFENEVESYKATELNVKEMKVKIMKMSVDGKLSKFYKMFDSDNATICSYDDLECLSVGDMGDYGQLLHVKSKKACSSSDSRKEFINLLFSLCDNNIFDVTTAISDDQLRSLIIERLESSDDNVVKALINSYNHSEAAVEPVTLIKNDDDKVSLNPEKVITYIMEYLIHNDVTFTSTEIGCAIYVLKWFLKSKQVKL